jgi:hypothetical protein
MELITKDIWDDPFVNKSLLLYCKLNELIPYINENNKTDFRLLKETESIPSGVDHWNDIIDYLNKKYKCNIIHVSKVSSFSEAFNTLNNMIELTNSKGVNYELNNLL